MNSSAAHEMPMLKTVPTERKRNALEDVTVTLLNNWIVVDGVDVVDNAMLLELILLLSLSLFFFFSSNACVYIYIYKTQISSSSSSSLLLLISL